MKFYTTAAFEQSTAGWPTRPNLNLTSEYGQTIFTDIGGSTNKLNSLAGNVGNILNSSNTNAPAVGLLFYDRGFAVFDLNKIISGSQHVSGTISAMNVNSGSGFNAGQTLIGDPVSQNPSAKFIPDLMISGSIDNIVDHIAACRFSSGSQTAITFQNVTNINSMLVFCNLDANSFNYSSNPTYVNSSDNRIVVIDQGSEEVQQSFTFITRLSLMDSNDNVLAVGALSRPIEKSSERNLTITLRIDF